MGIINHADSQQEQQSQLQQIIYDGNFELLVEGDIFVNAVQVKINDYIARSMPEEHDLDDHIKEALDAGDYIQLAALAYFKLML